MARFTGTRLAKRDDPIFKEGLTIFTPRSARLSAKEVAELKANIRAKAKARTKATPQLGPEEEA